MVQFGRRESPDERDANFPIKMALDRVTKKKRTRRYWKDTYWFGNQGNTPRCVGYSWAHFLEDGPILHEADSPVIDPDWLYHEAQKVDAWPGEDYDGTSVRAGAKVLKAEGFIKEYLWAQYIQDIIDTILHIGPVVVGTMWYEGMMRPSRNNRYRLEPTGNAVGGHAYELNGIDTRKRIIRVKNSWGQRWGYKGRALISFTDMKTLFEERGEACLAIETKT
jgi:hypothetical protein